MDGKVRVYDLIKKTMFRELMPENESQLISLEVEQSGELVFAGGMDSNGIFIWSFQSGFLLEKLSIHSGPVSHLIYSKRL